MGLMKGIVLAGGSGSTGLIRLTKITNKHLLPIYDKPMHLLPFIHGLWWDAGIRDILVVTGGKNAGDFLRLPANGKHFGLQSISGYAYQEGEGQELPTPWRLPNTSRAATLRLCVIMGTTSFRAAFERRWINSGNRRAGRGFC